MRRGTVMRNKKGIVSKLLGLLFVLVVVVSFTGCMTSRPIVNNASFPADGSKYVILGRVSVELDLAKSGGGYTSLIKEAKKLYPNADDVVNIVMDGKGKRNGKVLRYVTISGVAIDYKEAN